MLKIMTTGVEDYLDGSANIKALVIGGPGAGKTRMSSYWPKPIFLDCENGRGSLADRNMPYVEIHSSKDVLDALEYLKTLESTPKVSRQFQTVVFDTADSFQRLVKDEWVQQTKASVFTGYDAWGYLDTKMQMLFTRLLNLDYNVLVLVHFKDKTFKDGENTVREFMLQLQGAMADQIFNDFGLVGFLGTYWDTDGENRVQKRGLTFQPTPAKPFLKDRFNVTPTWMPIEFVDADYGQLFEAFFNRDEFEGLAESAVVGEIPDAGKTKAADVQAPLEGGPLPAHEAAPVPLEKKLKSELDAIARDLGIIVRGNMLKSELVVAIQDVMEKAKPLPAEVVNEVKEIGSPNGVAAGGSTPVATPETGPIASENPLDPTELAASLQKPSQPEQKRAPAADAQPASPGSSSQNGTSSGTTLVEDPPMTFEGVLEGLGGTVISHETTDAPTPQLNPTPAAVATTEAARGPSVCADCGKSLAEEWADPSKKGYIRLSFVKFRRYLDTGCYAIAVNK